MVGDTELPAWSLKDLDFVAGDLFFSIKPLLNPTDNGTNQVMFGAPHVVIRWQKPLDGQLQALLQFPGATEKSHDGTTFVELPIIPALGPTNMCVCRLDDYSLLAAQSQDVMLSRLKKMRGPAESKPWHQAFKAVDGGLMTFVSTDANFVRPFGEPVDEDAKAFSDFFAESRVHAIGVDWQERPGGISAAKMQFGFDTEEGANLLLNLVKTCGKKVVKAAPAAAADANNQSAPAAENAQRMVKTLVTAIEGAKIRSRRTASCWTVDLQIAAPLDWRPLLQQ
jgi:hypothetical protein